MQILIVEDEKISQKKLEKVLNLLDYNVLVANNGKEGLDLWKKNRPEIIITDWTMPEMNGIELCKKVREEEGSHYTYIIMVTNKESVIDMVESIEAGADDFITKPYIKEELTVKIKVAQRILKIESKDIVIFAMANLAESRDPETGYHLDRIRFYTKILAEKLYENNTIEEVNKTFIEDIFLTSPLHDIGKIGIPDFILLKPGRLDEKEFDIMKSHCEIGYNALNSALKKYPKADYLKMCADIALYHHEKVDGSGYPKKIKLDQIPLSARITALADVYDALVCKRVYKDALTHSVAKSIILDGAGTHFDPTLVKTFLESEDAFIEIHNKYKEK